MRRSRWRTRSPIATTHRRRENSASTGRAVSDDFGANALPVVMDVQSEDRLRGHSREARSDRVAIKAASRREHESIAVVVANVITPSGLPPIQKCRECLTWYRWYRHEAQRFVAELRERLARFGLELHPDKTRLIEFGRFAAQSRKRRGEGKPETFDFLGFTHICGETRQGRFSILRQTMAKKMRAKLKAIKHELRRRLHSSIPEVGRWLRTVLLGHYRYYGVHHNYNALKVFHHEVTRRWLRALRRRSQRTSVTWERMQRLVRSWLPYPRIMHPFPEERLRV